MKLKYFTLLFWTFGTLFAQNEKANNLVVEGNDFHEDKKYISAEAQYRKALALDETRTDAQHNLGNTLYRTQDYTAAAQRYFLTQKGSEDKQEKHAAFHNIGNVHMQAKEYEKAVESYKQALRNNPQDEESRYNYTLAKELLEKQKQEQEQNQDQQDQNQDQDQDQNQDQNQDQENKDKDSSEGDQKEDKSEDKQNEGDEKKEEGDQGEKEKEQEKNSDQQKKGNEDKPNNKPPRQPGQISPEQVQSLLKAMNQQEREVQDKVNAEKVKGVPIKTKKDW